MSFSFPPLVSLKRMQQCFEFQSISLYWWSCNKEIDSWTQLSNKGYGTRHFRAKPVLNRWSLLLGMWFLRNNCCLGLSSLFSTLSFISDVLLLSWGSVNYPYQFIISFSWRTNPHPVISLSNFVILSRLRQTSMVPT